MVRRPHLQLTAHSTAVAHLRQCRLNQGGGHSKSLVIRVYGNIQQGSQVKHLLVGKEAAKLALRLSDKHLA